MNSYGKEKKKANVKEQYDNSVTFKHCNKKKRTFFNRDNVVTVNYLLFNMTDLCK